MRLKAKYGKRLRYSLIHNCAAIYRSYSLLTRLFPAWQHILYRISKQQTIQMDFPQVQNAKDTFNANPVQANLSQTFVSMAPIAISLYLSNIQINYFPQVNDRRQFVRVRHFCLYLTAQYFTYILTITFTDHNQRFLSIIFWVNGRYGIEHRIFQYNEKTIF